MLRSPDSDSTRVLQLVAHRDGQLTVTRLAQLLDPWPAAPIPHVPGALAARRAARKAHFDQARLRVRTALSQLVKAGLVAPVGTVELWSDALERWLARGPDSLARLGPITGDDEDWLTPTALVPPSVLAVAIVEALAEGPQSVQDLADATGGRLPSGKVSGAWRWAYRCLCLEQVVRPPRARRLTDAGWAALEVRAA